MDGFREWKKGITDQEIIEGSLELFEESLDYESDVREDMVDDIKFENGRGHWGDARAQREIDQRPCLVVPRLNQFLNIIRNEGRQNKPSIKISARGASDNDQKKQKQRVKAAERRQGLLRHIQYSSKATQAYQMGYDHSTGCGRGFFRIIEEYVPGSMDKKIVIEMVKNPLSVHPGKRKELYDYSDMKWCHIIDTMKRKRFQEEYPDAPVTSWDSESTPQNSDEQGDEVRIAEFYCTWIVKKKLCLVEPYEFNMFGSKTESEPYTAYEDELDDEEKQFITDKREESVPMVKWYKMTQDTILDRADVKGTFIPVIPVIGVEKDVDGSLEIKGLVRDAKDIARMYDYWVSSEAEYLTTLPKAPYIIAAGQIEGYVDDWADSNRVTKAALVYKEKTVGGTMVPPPQKVQPPTVPTGIVNAKIATIDDMKAVLGMYADNLGEQGSEKSGVAIMARQRQGDRSNYHYLDNLGISLQHAGVIINQWMPDVYDGTRQEQILGTDDEPELITLNSQDEKTGESTDLGDGDYDVAVSMAPANNTKRQEQTEFMMELVRSFPQMTPLIYDLLVKNIDAPGAQIIADRLRKTIPPHILEEAGGEQELAMKLQQAVQQLQQVKPIMEEMAQKLQEHESEAKEKDLDRTVDVHVAELQSQTAIKVAEINAITKADSDKKNFILKFFQSVNKPITTKQSVT